MKTLFLVFVFLLAPCFVSAQYLLTAYQGYDINVDFNECTQFRVDLYLNLSKFPNTKIWKMTFDVADDAGDNERKKLQYRHYKQGTRYPDPSFTKGDSLGPDADKLEAKVKWWTFPNEVKDTEKEHIVNVTFLVGKGPSISWQEQFNVIQLYYKFLGQHDFRDDEKIYVHLNNIKLYAEGSSEPLRVADFTVVIKFSPLPNAVVENSTDEQEILAYPNPANNVLHLAEQTKVYDQSGRLVLENKDRMPVTLNTSALPNGIYFVVSVKHRQIIQISR